MTDAFSSVWAKIERAKKHANDLEAEIIAFWGTNSYEVEIEGNPKTGPASYRIKGAPQPLPECLPLIAGDVAHNLRSALDHFACGAVTTVTANTAFPVWRARRVPSRNDWAGLVKGKLKDASPRLIKAVTSLKAYEAGDDQYIWAADALDRIDKHRLLLAVAGANTAVILDFGDLANQMTPGNSSWPTMPFALKPHWTPVEGGTELYVVPAGPDFYTEPKFTFDVTLGEPEVLKGEPVVPALRRLIDELEGLIKRFVPLV